MVSAIALFCDDIREEKSGVVSAIGILPDNINVASVPFIFPKLVIYARISFETTGEPPRVINLRLVHADNKEAPLTAFDEAIIQRGLRESQEKGAANAGLVATAIMSPFRVRQAGRINVVAKIDDKDIICGTLNIQLTKS